MLSLSRTIAENKNEYYKAFTEAEDKLNSGELTFFVYTILGLIERAQESLIEELGVKIDQLDKATVLRDELRRNMHCPRTRPCFSTQSCRRSCSTPPSP